MNRFLTKQLRSVRANLTKRKENNMNKEKAVEKKQDTQVAAQGNKALALHAQSEFKGSSANLDLPRILVVNSNTQEESIKALKLDAGTIIDTATLETLAKPGEPIRIVPLATTSSWLIYEVRGGKKEFKGVEEFTGEKLEYETPIDKNTSLRRVLGIRLLFLIQKEIEAGNAIPYSFTFKNSSATAGKKLNTIMYVRNKLAGRAPWAAMVDLFSVEKTREGNTFSTMDLKQVAERGTNEVEMQAAEFWYSKFVAGSVTVSEDELDNE